MVTLETALGKTTPSTCSSWAVASRCRHLLVRPYMTHLRLRTYICLYCLAVFWCFFFQSHISHCSGRGCNGCRTSTRYVMRVLSRVGIQSHCHQHQCTGAFNTCCYMFVIHTCQCDVSTPMLLHVRTLSLNRMHTSCDCVYVHHHYQCGALSADVYKTLNDVCAACEHTLLVTLISTDCCCL